MSTYTYNKFQSGYRWNAIQRIKDSVGLEPLQICNLQIDGIEKTQITFNRELTELEKANLDNIVANNPEFPPAPVGTVYKIDDIWEKLANFRSTTNIQWKLYFSQSTPGGPIDQIELHANTTLTTQQKKPNKKCFRGVDKGGVKWQFCVTN